LCGCGESSLNTKSKQKCGLMLKITSECSRAHFEAHKREEEPFIGKQAIFVVSSAFLLVKEITFFK